MVGGAHDGEWRSTGGSGHDCPEPTSGLKHRGNAFLWGNCDELQVHGQKMDPARHSIPPYLQPGRPTRPGGDPDTLPGPKSNSIRGPQRQNLIPEPQHSAGL